VEYTLIDGKNLDEWHKAVRPNTKVFFFESPTNPTLELIDIKGVVKLAKEIGVTTVIDNVFATPMWQKPIELGIDVVAYSATKHIDGQGRCLGGVILSSQKWIDEVLFDYFRHTGPSMSPFNAWVLLKGLETLPIRVKTQTESAAKIADSLTNHKAIEQVIYPGHKDFPQNDLVKSQMGAGSTIMALRIKGGKEASFKMVNALNVIKISNNVGDAKSLITHPATTTHKNLSEEAREELGICDGLLRLSIGLEDVDDLIEDLTQALASCT
jgi:O-succinylhomoserine sulfhydrylase